MLIWICGVGLVSVVCLEALFVLLPLDIARPLVAGIDTAARDIGGLPEMGLKLLLS